MFFAHMSDTHILKNVPPANATGIPAVLCEAEKNLRQAIQTALGLCPQMDFFIFTGDLVHEGTAEDYRFLKQILIEALGDIPCYVALGNHDRHAAFYEGFIGNTKTEEPYNVAYLQDGLRIISLDSSPTDGCAAGCITAEALAFLQKEVSAPAPRGSILLLHHPPQGMPYPLFNQMEGLLNESAALCSVVENSDIRAVFSGHTHATGFHSHGGALFATAAGTAFSVDPGNLEYITIKNDSGFNICQLDDGHIRVGTVALPREGRVLCSIPIKQMWDEQ